MGTARRWQTAFGPSAAAVQGGGAGEWHTGAWDAGKDARSVHIVRDLQGDGMVVREGGEASECMGRARVGARGGAFLISR